MDAALSSIPFAGEALKSGRSRWTAANVDGLARLFPRWSPDGEWIYYLQESSGLARTWASADEASESVSERAFLVGWSVEGDEIYVYRDGAFWETSPDTSAADRPLTDLEGRRGNVIGLSADTDGRYLYFAWQEDLGDIWVMDVAR